MNKQKEGEKESRVTENFRDEAVSVYTWAKDRVIGRGSYGVVYLGLPARPHLPKVAIKAAPYQYSSSLFKEKLILEKFIAVPQIVQCLGDVLTLDGRRDHVYNLVLEYAAGGTLAGLIAAHENKKLPEPDVKDFLRMILQGLSCIHAKGFVHSDLKPDNILAFPLGNGKMQLKIADFGLSRRFDKKKKFEDQMKKFCRKKCKLKFRGTPRYMSPESLVGEIKPSLDIWSVGCILIRMVSGKEIWNDCTATEQLLSKLVFETELPKAPKELSCHGNDFLQKCFERNPERRWTADMLLKHPYLVEQTGTRNHSFKSLQLFLRLSIIIIFVIIFFPIFCS